MSQIEESVLDLGEADKLTMDEFARRLIGQMFENDNDTSTLTTTLVNDQDNTTSVVVFDIIIKSINGQSPEGDT